MTTLQQPEKQWTVLEILRWTTDYFQQKQVDAPRVTAEVLLAHVLEQDRIHLYVHFDQPLEAEERTRFKTLIKQRVRGVPTQYLTGKQEFWSLEFQVTPDVLIPRPETEHLVEAAVECARTLAQPRIVDIGTGSGIIAISLKHELPEALVCAGDLSEQALNIARRNASALLGDALTIHFQHGDLFTPFAGMKFDLIVSNPPYIAAADYENLAPHIRNHEPALALQAGEHGLDVYQRLIADAGDHLDANGVVLVEIGYGQQDAVSALFEGWGFSIQRIIKDYAGIDRVVIAQRRT